MAFIAIFGDTHFGVSNSNNFFLKYQEEFFKTLKEELIKLGVTDIIHLGDLYDVRKNINFKTLQQSFNFFSKNFLDSPFNVHIIVGNHDSYNKNSLKINAPRELLGWSDFNIYDYPQEIQIGDLTFLMVPWICAENEEESFYLLNNSDADYCCGHFDISGFKMLRNMFNKGGMDRLLFKRFNMTFSGHFHLPSEQNNIMYIGSPYQLSWNDYGDVKRIVLLDTETKKLSFIENHNFIYKKIFYKPGIVLKDSEYCDKIVKIYVDADQNSYEFDKFFKQLQEQNPHSVNVIDLINLDDTVEDASGIAKKDTMEFLVEYIEETSMESEEKNTLVHLMNDLYKEAQDNK